MQHKRVTIEPFRDQDAQTVLSWVTSADELYDWTFRDDYPLMDLDVFAQWHADPDIHAYCQRYDGQPSAYGELWIDDIIEFARLLVAPKLRGRGLGRLLIEQLAALPASSPAAEIWLRVAPSNERAISIYRHIGFARATSDEARVHNEGQQVDFVWLSRNNS
jgi:ribosomal protein S18 acetylase RimI-like enzyme